MPETMEDMEFETEWPGRTVLEESLETIDNGRGMIETSSEKPTRVFLSAFGLGSGSAKSDIDLAGCNIASIDPGTTGCCSCIAEGDVGALPPRLIFALGFSINVKSLTLIAADRLCACPRRPPGGPMVEGGGGRAPSALVGLVDINPAPAPVLPSPPMNSETFLWCMLLGLGGIVLGDTSDGDADVEDEPKENSGSLSPSPVRSFEWLRISIALRGRRPDAREKEVGADRMEVEVGDGALAGKTKLGSGSGPGLVNRGDCEDCETLSTVVEWKRLLSRSIPLNDILPGEAAAAIVSMPHGGQFRLPARLRALNTRANYRRDPPKRCTRSVGAGASENLGSKGEFGREQQPNQT